MENVTLEARRYSRGAIVLHWLIALLIIVNFGLAWAREDLPREESIALLQNHKSIGIIVLLLTALRIVWRLTHKPPPLLDTLKAWEAGLAKVTHGLFYFAMVAVPLAGWAGSSSFMKGKPVSVFGLFEVPALPVGHDKASSDLYHELHEVLATLMLALVVLHILAALKHQFLDRDGTLRRMVPWLS